MEQTHATTSWMNSETFVDVFNQSAVQNLIATLALVIGAIALRHAIAEALRHNAKAGSNNKSFAPTSTNTNTTLPAILCKPDPTAVPPVNSPAKQQTSIYDRLSRPIEAIFISCYTTRLA